VAQHQKLRGTLYISYRLRADIFFKSDFDD
jgi:hypothetical protein